MNWHFQDLDQTIDDFTEIQSEINYHQAQESLRHLLQNLDLTTQERRGLESEIDQLAEMLDKLEHSVLQIAAFGLVGRGKSSVLNALLGTNIFQTGALHGITTDIDRAKWQLQEEKIAQGTIQKLSIFSQENSQLELIDTPGIDEINGETREQLAKVVAQQMDLILFVIAGDMSRVEFEALSQLRELGKPILLVFNKVDQYPEADRHLIYRTICDRRVKELLSPEEIVMVSAAPLTAQMVTDAQGIRKIQKVRGVPDVQELKLKILEILHREGKALLALNSMLYADNLSTKLVRRKLLLREEAADHLIDRAMLTKAVVVALNPVTVVDVFSGAMVDVALIVALSNLYGLSLRQQEAIALLKNIALNMGGISASELLANLGLSSLKGVLGVAAPMTGGLSLAPYLSVAIAQGSVAGISTRIIGQAGKTYLANGGAWPETDPRKVVQDIIESLDEKSILYRLKQELTAKLTPKISSFL